MANWQQVEAAIKEGWVAQRANWPSCKKIRKYTIGDADYFANDFDTKSAIIQECENECDCKIGIYIVEPGDKEAEDWIFLSQERS